jgi:hypothetical protein
MKYYDIYAYITAIGLTPGGSSTSQIYTQTTQIIQRKENLGSLGSAAVPCLCELYPGICLETGKKHGKSSVRVAQNKNNEQAQYKNNEIQYTEEKQ